MPRRLRHQKRAAVPRVMADVESTWRGQSLSSPRSVLGWEGLPGTGSETLGDSGLPALGPVPFICFPNEKPVSDPPYNFSLKHRKFSQLS